MEVFRIRQDAPIYYLTFTIVHWLPLFIGEESCLIVADSLTFCHQQKGLRINAFVIMPTHLHLIAFDADFDNRRLQKTLAAMRKYTGRRLADYCEQKMPAVFAQVLWGTRRADRGRQVWQQSRHPKAIHSRAFWRKKIGYLHDNPRRKGLVRDVTHWRFSSAAYWLLDPPGETDVPLTGVEW